MLTTFDYVLSLEVNSNDDKNWKRRNRQERGNNQYFCKIRRCIKNMYEEMFKACGKKIHLLTKLDNFSVGFPGLVTNTQTLS